MKKDITELFVCLDDFCKIYDEVLQSKAIPGSGRAYKTRATGLWLFQKLCLFLSFFRAQAVPILILSMGFIGLFINTIFSSFVITIGLFHSFLGPLGPYLSSLISSHQNPKKWAGILSTHPKFLFVLISVLRETKSLQTLIL